MERFSFDLLSAHRTLWILTAPVAIAIAVWVYYGTIAPLTRPARTVLRVLRGLAFLIVLFALAEPVLTLVMPEPGKPGLAVLVDHSASMRQAGNGSGSRVDEASAIERLVVDRLAGKYRIDRFQFATGLTHAGDDPGAASASPAGNTAIGDALRALGSRQGSRPVSGVIMLTDGTNTVGADPVGAAREIGIPVFPVRVGAALAPADARILAVRSNPTAYTGEPALLDVEIASSGLAGRTLELRVEDQGRLLASKPVILQQGNDVEQAIRIDVRPVGLGLRRWEIRLAGEEDGIPENDARSVAVRVLERKTRVLYVEGRLDWDFTFLRRTLAADSAFSYRFMIADRNGRWISSGRASGTGPGDLRDYAAVILGEVPPAVLTGAFYDDLVRYVRAGGGLLILGGRAGVSRLRSTPIEALLPAEAFPVSRSESRPAAIRVAPQGLTHPLTALEDSPARSEADWASLPPVWPSPDRLRPRPGSQVLLGFNAPGIAGEPALVSGFAGEGKILVLAAHDFWRWDFLPRETAGIDAFPEFALRTVRWLAEPSARERFAAQPASGVFENGEVPEFTARVWDDGYAPILDAQVHVTIKGTDGTASITRDLDLRPHGGDGTYAGQTDPLPPGGYGFVAEARAGGQPSPLGRIESSFWVDRNGPEYVRLRPDPGTMDQIARASGGQSVDRAGLDALLDRIPTVVRRVGRVREIDLWNHIALFLSFVALLSVEWWLRRRRGLA
jgi:hypothetical protein